MSSPPLHHHLPTTPPFHPHNQPFIMRPNTTSINNAQLDEGYSEETRSEPDSDMTFTASDEALLDASAAEILQTTLGLPADKRKGGTRQPDFIPCAPVLLGHTTPSIMHRVANNRVFSLTKD